MKLTAITYTYAMEGRALKPADIVREVMIDDKHPDEITIFGGVAHVTYRYGEVDEEADVQ